MSDRVQAPGVSVDCNVLLTLGRDGVARLWSPTQHPEPEPLRFHLCATLPLAGLTTGGQEAGSPRRPSDPRWMQWVQWLQASGNANPQSREPGMRNQPARILGATN